MRHYKYLLGINMVDLEIIKGNIISMKKCNASALYIFVPISIVCLGFRKSIFVILNMIYI